MKMGDRVCYETVNGTLIFGNIIEVREDNRCRIEFDDVPFAYATWLDLFRVTEQRHYQAKHHAALLGVTP